MATEHEHTPKDTHISWEHIVAQLMLSVLRVIEERSLPTKVLYQAEALYKKHEAYKELRDHLTEEARTRSLDKLENDMLTFLILYKPDEPTELESE